MNSAPDLRHRAEDLTGSLPSLFLRAEKIAQAVLQGVHGRRRAGVGEEFWQYRPIQPGDSYRMVDWRRSGRSDVQFVRQRERRMPQTVSFWVDLSQSMQFASDVKLASKLDRAQLIALALAVLFGRGGERINVLGGQMPPAAGEAQLRRIVSALVTESEEEFATPYLGEAPQHGFVVVLSDFLGNLEVLEAELESLARRDVQGVLLQILDPAEEVFPYRGRRIFETAKQTLSYETQQATNLAERYKERLAGRKAKLDALAKQFGWSYRTHRTDESAQAALLWLYQLAEGRR